MVRGDFASGDSKMPRAYLRMATKLVLAGMPLIFGCDSAPDVGKTQPTDSSHAAADQPGSGSRPSDEPAATVSAAGEITFVDQVQTNAEPPGGLEELEFIDTEGHTVALRDYLGKKNVVLVFTRGFSGMLCPFCTTQTSRLVAGYDRFQALDAEVLVVFPGSREHVNDFVEAARTTAKEQVDRVPFPILLDERMAAVDFFDIRATLARPSTYIIDKRGNVRLAYVSEDMLADRPSVRAMLETLEAANADDSSSDAGPGTDAGE
jgi:peroxiredoxin